MDNKYIANRQQIMRLRDFRYEGGAAQGVRACEVQSGQLLATVVADRCMDIYEIMFKGINLGFINSMGVCAPAYYDNKGDNFQYTFTAGFMSTCGLASYGAACFDGEELGQHGRIGAVPARNFCARYTSEGAELSGEMVEARLFKENYRLERKYTFDKPNCFSLTDTITNMASREVPFQVLYHINVGYPLLDESCELLLPTKRVVPRDEPSAEGADRWRIVESPADNVTEQCFYHELGQKDGRSVAGIYNKGLGIGFIYTFDKEVLDEFVEWKYPCSGEYVLGLEPGNSMVNGRDIARREGKLKTLKPGEQVTHTMHFRFFDSSEYDGIAWLIKQYK